MIAITTSNSISVKPRTYRGANGERIGKLLFYERGLKARNVIAGSKAGNGPNHVASEQERLKKGVSPSGIRRTFGVRSILGREPPPIPVVACNRVGRKETCQGGKQFMQRGRD
jgi:hypothetical protein